LFGGRDGAFVDEAADRTGPQRIPRGGPLPAVLGDRDRRWLFRTRGAALSRGRTRTLLSSRRGGRSGFAIVLGAVLGITEQVIGGDQLLQLCVASRGSRIALTRIGVKGPQLGTKRVVNLCRCGDGSHPEHDIGIVILGHGNPTRHVTGQLRRRSRLSGSCPPCAAMSTRPVGCCCPAQLSALDYAAALLLGLCCQAPAAGTDIPAADPADAVTSHAAHIGCATVRGGAHAGVV